VGALRGAATRLGGPALVGAAEGYNVASTLADPASSGTDMVREVGRSALRGGATLLGGAGGAMLGGPVGAIAGGVGGYAVGDAAANAVFGPKRVAAAPVIPQATTMPTAQRVNDVAVPQQERLDPNAMLDNPRTPIPEGTGAFRRTGAKNATLVDSRAAKLRDAQTQVPASQKIGPAGFLGGLTARVASVKSAQAGANAENTAIAQQMKAAALRLQMRQQREKGVESELRNEVVRDPELAGMAKEEREAATNQRVADISQRFARSAASQGKELGDLSTVETSQLRSLEQFRKGLEKQRGGIDNFVRSFIGNKQFDHENLYDYAPESVRDAALGAILTMRGGNEVRVDKVVRNGETHWFSPNDPLKTDLTDLVEIARKSKKGAK